MGSNQSNTSHTARNIGETVVIERSEIPEEYQDVKVSPTVISRVNKQNDQKIADQKEKSENGLASVKKEDTHNIQYVPIKEVKFIEKSLPISENDIEAKKAVFKNAAKRVDDRFFKFQRENECTRNEDSILACLNVNKNVPWNCSNLVQEYDNCITSFLQKVSTQQ